MAPPQQRDAPCRPAPPRKRASFPSQELPPGHLSASVRPRSPARLLLIACYLSRLLLRRIRTCRGRCGTLQIRFLTTRIVHPFHRARQSGKRRASEFSWPFTNPGPPSCGSLRHYWNRSEVRPRSGFPESFTAVVDGFTSGAGSFKFSRSVLKILKLFLEVSDDAGEQGGEVIPRRGE